MIIYGMFKIKTSDFYLFVISELNHIRLFLVFGILIASYVVFTKAPNTTFFSIFLTGFLMYLIFLFQLFENYKKHRLKKNSLILSMLTELNQNVQLLFDLRDNFINHGAPKFIKRINADKKIPLKEKIEITTILGMLNSDTLSNKSDSVGFIIGKLEKLYTNEENDLVRERRANYFVKHMPAHWMTFNFENKLTYIALSEMKIKSKNDLNLVQSLGEYVWYSKIMEYTFNLMTNWHNYKNHSDSIWYLNAIIARPQYSKDTLEKVKGVLKRLHDDDEVIINLKTSKFKNLLTLSNSEI